MAAGDGGLRPGATFAGHRIEAIAGRGGMGVVYKATHLALDHVVALKVISPQLAGDESFRARFQSESRIAVSIRHPNVVSVHHAGEEDGLLFVTMDYVEGTDVRGLLNREGRLEPSDAASILEQVASALDAAHSRGLIHRDIKPGNVLIESRPDGDHAYLSDFGLARAIDAETGVTASGAFVGTLDYAAPEQIKGNRLDARTDVYALGCLLHEMLAGSTPFVRQTEKVAKMYAHLQETPPTLMELRPELGDGLSAVVARAMAKDPADRFQSAGDLGRAASAAIEGRSFGPEEGTVAIGEAAPAAVTATMPAATEPVAPEGTAPHEATEPTEGPTAELAATAGAAEPKTQTAPGTAPPTTRRRQTRRRLIAVGAIAGALAAAAAAVTLITGGDGESGPQPEPVESATGDDPGGQAAERPGNAEVMPGRIAVDGFPVGIAVAFDSLWVGSRTGDTLTEIDPQTKEPVQTIDGLAAPEGVTAGPESIFVAVSDADSVLRIDPDTGSQSLIPVSGSFPRAVAHGGPGIYVTNADSGTVSPFDLGPGSAEPLPDIPVGGQPHGIAIGAGAAWVTNRADGTVSRIDEESNLVTDTITVGANPKGVAVAGGVVWVANTDDDTVTPIDASSGEAGKPLAVAGEPRGVAAGFGSVWVANGGGSVTRIDPRSGKVAQEMALGSSPEEVAIGNKFVYVSDGEADSVYRIRP